MVIFFKMQALGNDFLVIDCTNENLKYSYDNFTKFLCDRHFGIGADGIIYFYKSTTADIKMRIFNSDGTEAEMCGNGIRCLARFLYDKKVINKKEFNIETLAGIKKIKISGENNEIIEVNMGKVNFDINTIPVYLPSGYNKKTIPDIEISYKNNNFIFNSVSVGNPHTVCFLNNFNEIDIDDIGKFVESYKFFPKKTNVEFVMVENKNKINIKVWERGVGRTLGCGTGAIASSAIAMEKLYTESDIIVELEGGKVRVKKENDEMFLIGGAEFICEGKIDNL